MSFLVFLRCNDAIHLNKFMIQLLLELVMLLIYLISFLSAENLIRLTL